MENKLSREQFESKESEPIQSDLRVDFVRHGKPEYTKEELQASEFEGTLTGKGVEQASERAAELASQINKEKELVVFWASPKRRAQQTAKIIMDVFLGQGIPMVEGLRTVKSLTDTKMSSEFVDELLKNDAIGKWMEYWTESDLPAGTEKPEEVKKRVERVITYLERIARNIVPVDGKKLHFICVGHEEIFRDLLEEGYGLGTKDNTGPSYGEILNLDINKSEQGKDALLRLQYHDQRTSLGFNMESRKFYKKDDKTAFVS